MNYRNIITWFSFLFVICLPAIAQQAEWPRTMRSASGIQIKMYEPELQTYSGNQLNIQAAISILEQGKPDPLFGLMWAVVTIENQRNKNVTWSHISVTNIKFPGELSETETNQLKTTLEQEIPQLDITIPESDLLTKLKSAEKQAELTGDLQTNPPRIIYTQQPSILVLIDGQPQLEKNPDWGVDQVVNTAYTIFRNAEQQYYLYGDKKWYSSTSIRGPWKYVPQIPSSLAKADQAVKAADTSKSVYTDNSVSQIIVSTEPAELIQSKGEANFSPIQGTDLLYMTNSVNDIFMDIHSQQYYVLISGRWYKSANLNSDWTYTSSADLPGDFAKIPVGSPRDAVLSSVAGTPAANESLLEAQLPQTAKVDRSKASATVTYDGDPQFEDIEGTTLKYAINSPGAVLYTGRTYYYVENGVWFQSHSPNGPWVVSTQRPAEVDNIPPSYPVYNVKYVYIYDYTPDYVYMGYTPGYLGTYIYGPTTVYGTGYYYRPWRGRFYYPRPATWGFNMSYNPWLGWSFGLNIQSGWFFPGFGNYHRTSCWGGWWGPTVYHPPYYRSYNRHYGRNVTINNYTIINNRSNNIYRYRRDVVTYDRPGYGGYNSRRNDNRTTISRPTRDSYNNRQQTVNTQTRDTQQRQGMDNADNRTRGNEATMPQRNNQPGRDVNQRIYSPNNRVNDRVADNNSTGAGNPAMPQRRIVTREDRPDYRGSAENNNGNMESRIYRPNNRAVPSRAPGEAQVNPRQENSRNMNAGQSRERVIMERQNQQVDRSPAQQIHRPSRENSRNSENSAEERSDNGLQGRRRG